MEKVVSELKNKESSKSSLQHQDEGPKLKGAPVGIKRQKLILETNRSISDLERESFGLESSRPIASIVTSS